MTARKAPKLKIQTHNNKYPHHQSPLYKLSSINKLARLLKTTVNQLKNFNQFNPNNYRIFKTKNDREVQQPINALYKLHNRIANLLSRISTPDWLHSYKKGASYITNATAHLNASQVITFDLKGFYQHITQNKVRKFFQTDLACSPDIAYLLSRICCFDNQIPTGSQVSIFLNFLANAKMFNEMYTLACKRNATITVYADDITISGNKVDFSLYNTMRKIVIRHGYTISEHKTKRFLSPQMPIVTGLAINNHRLQPPNSFYNKLRNRTGFLDRNMAMLDRDILEKEYDSIKGKNSYILNFVPVLPKKAKEVENKLTKVLGIQ